MRDRQLDGVRGISAFAIVMFHGHYVSWLEWTWVFVDCFFVLSGFLISRIILGGLKDGSFSLKNFVMRRVLRIWPVYYSVLVLCCMASAVLYWRVGEMKHLGGLGSAPFFLQFTHHYLAPGFHAGKEDFILWFHHSWTIAVEEQFYLLMPLLLMVFRRKLGLAFGMVALLIPAAVYFRIQGAHFWLLISQMDALAIGCVLAFYWTGAGSGGRCPRRAEPAVVALTGVLSLLLIFKFGRAFGWSEPASGAFYLLGFNLLFGTLLLVLLRGWVPVLNAILSSRPLCFLGTISYALYLFHVPVRGALLHFFQKESLMECPIWVHAVYFGGSILAAWLSKILIEDPVSRLKRYFPVSSASGSVEGQRDAAPCGV